MAHLIEHVDLAAALLVELDNLHHSERVLLLVLPRDARVLQELLPFLAVTIWAWKGVDVVGLSAFLHQNSPEFLPSIHRRPGWIAKLVMCCMSQHAEEIRLVFAGAAAVPGSDHSGLEGGGCAGGGVDCRPYPHTG